MLIIVFCDKNTHQRVPRSSIPKSDLSTSRDSAFVDALTIAGHVSSPVALSESLLFIRKFSSVYDALVHGELCDDLKIMFSNSQDPDWEMIAGYEIHATDATPNKRMAAETLADRGALKTQQKETVRYGHKLYGAKTTSEVSSRRKWLPMVIVK